MKTELTYKLETYAGNTFQSVAQTASEIAIEHGLVAEFDFNGIRCLVNAHTDPDHLFRDYMNARLMGWQTIGPDTVENYSPDIATELAARQQERDERRQKEQAEAETRDQLQREAIKQLLAGIELAITDQALFDSGKAQNTDSYGACIYEYAETWGRLMQYEMAQGKALEDCAKQTSFQLGYLGITGFMYGAAVSILAQGWQHGDALRIWHNAQYAHRGKGVVNPAVLTVSTSH